MNNPNKCTPENPAPAGKTKKETPGRPSRRRPGAPKGNQNAMCHGFYSQGFSDDIRRKLSALGGVSALDRELYLAFLKMKLVMLHDPGNESLVNKTFRALAKMVCLKYGIGRRDRDGIERFLPAAAFEFVALSARLNEFSFEEQP
jgi:hypothetical protein